ncbi:MAG TPA: flavin reductase family protein [Devosia sp.]|jgi:flavin reductase (DIM6/NTAB) family NADH-FMN oxidoreductase RutF|uniref:flavin reductase family protein n=1 Tax=Devosia sp. TaxID=1871048 RepID=UPI002F93A3FC
MLALCETETQAAADNFRQAMRHLASGVSIITAGTGADRSGFTATSVVSLSVYPPRLLVSIDERSATWPLIELNGGFTANLLSSGQKHLAEVFAGRTGLHGAERFVGSEWREYLYAGFALEGALATVHCRLEEVIERHGHRLVIGEVLGSRTLVAGALVYIGGRFTAL